jgi:hypothetical protein
VFAEEFDEPKLAEVVAKMDKLPAMVVAPANVLRPLAPPRITFP